MGEDALVCKREEIYFAAMLQQQHHCHSLQHEIPGSNSPPSSGPCPKFNFTIIHPKVKVKKLSKTFVLILCNDIDHNISDCHECLIWVTQPFNLFYTCLSGPTSPDVCVSFKSRSTKACKNHVLTQSSCQNHAPTKSSCKTTNCSRTGGAFLCSHTGMLHKPANVQFS